MPKYPYKYVTSSEDLGGIASKIAACPDRAPIGYDLETTHLIPWRGKPRLMQLNVAGEVFLVDLFKTGGPGPNIDALRHTQGVLVGHNLKFDQKWSKHHWGLDFGYLFDTYRASALLHAGQGMAHDLYSVYEREIPGCGHKTEDMGGSNWAGTLSEEQLDYAAEDVTFLPQLRDVLKDKILQAGLGKVAGIEFQVILAEAAMELYGFRLDSEWWLELAEKNRVECEELKGRLLYELPHPFGQLSLPGMNPTWNLNSTQQLQGSLKRLGFEVDSTSEEALMMLSGKLPVLDKLLRYKVLSKLLSSFGESYLEHIDPLTHRIHSEYYPFTDTGRYANSGPNLQQIPHDKAFRKCFRPGKGRKLTIADYSQIELRLAAQKAQDATMIRAYREGMDLHALTASLVTGIVLEKITKHERQLAKGVNFGLIYGLKPPRLVTYSKMNYGVDMTLEEAETFSQKYFAGYSGVARWHREALAHKNGITRSMLGRIRWMTPDAHNEYLNTPVQSSGADGLKRALRVVYNKLEDLHCDAHLAHTVHDEIAVDHPDDPEICQLVSQTLISGMLEGMEGIVTDMPVLAEGGTGDSWADKG